MKRALVAGLVPVGLLAVGCSLGGGPRAASGAAEEAAAVVEEFENAVAERDFRRICGELLSAEARRHAGGEECPRHLSRAGARVRQPELRVEEIELRGNAATVRLQARSRGEPGARETVELLRQDGRFRIAALRP